MRDPNQQPASGRTLPRPDATRGLTGPRAFLFLALLAACGHVETAYEYDQRVQAHYEQWRAQDATRRDISREAYDMLYGSDGGGLGPSGR